MAAHLPASAAGHVGAPRLPVPGGRRPGGRPQLPEYLPAPE